MWDVLNLLMNLVGSCSVWAFYRTAREVARKACLADVSGGDEEGSEVPETLKIGPAFFVQFIGQAVQVGDTIFEDIDSLGIEPFRTIKEIYNTSADHRIKGHEWTFILALHVRPSVILMCVPKRPHRILIHV